MRTLPPALKQAEEGSSSASILSCSSIQVWGPACCSCCLRTTARGTGRGRTVRGSQADARDGTCAEAGGGAAQQRLDILSLLQLSRWEALHAAILAQQLSDSSRVRRTRRGERRSWCTPDATMHSARWLTNLVRSGGEQQTETAGSSQFK